MTTIATTTTFTKTTFRIREFTAAGTVFSTFGDYEYKWEAQSIIDILALTQTDGHTYAIIKITETIVESAA